MNPLSLLPTSMLGQPYLRLLRFAAVLLTAIALFATGWHYGAAGVLRSWELEQAKEAVAISNQKVASATRVASVVLKQTTTTENVDVDYQAARIALAGVSASGLHHKPAPPTGGVSTPPTSAGQPNAGSPDLGSGTNQLAPSTECPADEGLRKDAAATTLTLLYLQHWIVSQGMAPPVIQ